MIVLDKRYHNFACTILNSNINNIANLTWVC